MKQPKEIWFVKYWRPSAAWIYLIICVFDFVIMPIYVAKTNLKIEEVVRVASGFEGSEKIAALTILMKKNTWEPLTVQESGLVHLSFGAILGVAAYTRGRVQEARERSPYPRYDENSQTNTNPNTSIQAQYGPQGTFKNVDNPG